MIAEVLVDALKLPADARVDRRVPKSLLLENGAPTAADKRLIQSGIEEMTWVAALKPTNIGVPAFKDAKREYLEISVLTVALRGSTRSPRLTELLHRAIPYPVVLWSVDGIFASLSLAHKRWSEGEAGEVVVEEVRRTTWFQPKALDSIDAAFLASLTLSGLPSLDLHALYQGLIDRVGALDAAAITGTLTLATTAEHAASRLAALESHTALQREVSALRSQAEKENQISRRVDLNLAIKRLEAQLTATIKEL